MASGFIDRRTLASSLLGLLAGFPRPVAARPDLPPRDYWPTAGWREAPPEDRGMDPLLLAEADRRMQAEAPLLSALLVVRGGDIVLERSYGAYRPDRPYHVWSVSKSITSIAVGLALEEGLFGLQQTLGELIPFRIPAGADPRVAGVTVEQLLTMSAGWLWDGRINFARFAETDDLDLMLARPLQCDPGGCFEYDSGSSNLLAYIVQVRAGEPMADFLQPRLFDPLGIAPPFWIVTDDGCNRGGGGAFMVPRDLAKIGFLYLNGGVWEDETIVSRDWVERSTRPQASGVSALSGVNIGEGPYGYHWWIAGSAGGPAFLAFGYGGQYVYVVPALDLVVVTGYAEADAALPELQQRPRPVIEELIVPAALAGPPR